MKEVQGEFGLREDMVPEEFLKGVGNTRNDGKEVCFGGAYG